MLANYGYVDGTGDYFIVIDTDKCDACEECLRVCPERVFEVAPDDYGKRVARVRDEVVTKVSYVCPGPRGCYASIDTNCQRVCQPGAIAHTWGVAAAVVEEE